MCEKKIENEEKEKNTMEKSIYIHKSSLVEEFNEKVEG